MTKKILISLISIFIASGVYAFDDCLVTNKGKLTDISIEDNTIVNVYPMATIMNEKDTLIFHPLKTGKTRVCVLKNNKNIIMFNVTVTELETIVDAPDGFEVLSIDKPFDEFEFTLDEPPKGVR